MVLVLMFVSILILGLSGGRGVHIHELPFLVLVFTYISLHCSWSVIVLGCSVVRNCLSLWELKIIVLLLSISKSTMLKLRSCCGSWNQNSFSLPFSISSLSSFLFLCLCLYLIGHTIILRFYSWLFAKGSVKLLLRKTVYGTGDQQLTMHTL